MRNNSLGTAVFTFIQYHTGIDFLIGNVQVVFRVGNTETQFIKTASGITQAVLQVDLGQLPGLGHVPVGDDHFSRPAVITDGIQNRVKGTLSAC
jgi:hypothetical protein